jgi:glycosyltransferase involved in cell wall biosynthesis
VVEPGDVDGLADGITALCADRAKLSRYRINSRRAAENFYSRNNTNQYWKALSAAKLW